MDVSDHVWSLGTRKSKGKGGKGGREEHVWFSMFEGSIIGFLKLFFSKKYTQPIISFRLNHNIVKDPILMKLTSNLQCQLIFRYSLKRRKIKSIESPFVGNYTEYLRPFLSRSVTIQLF